MDSSEEESLDYIQLIPYESYPFEKARHRTTIKWLLSRAYGGYGKIPEELREPFYEDDEGLPHLKPPIVHGLADADLYTRALHNLYRDPNYSNLSPWGVVQLLTRKGVFIGKLEDGASITETVLIQSCPLRMSPHLLLIESLQQLYIKEMLYRRSKRSLPSDVEEALLLYVNESVMGVKERVGRPPPPSPTHFTARTPPPLPPGQLQNLLQLQPYQDLSDLSDGVGLCLLLASRGLIQLERIVLPSPGEHLNVAEALTNLQLFTAHYETCFGYEDLLYMDKSIRLNVVCLLAELYGGGTSTGGPAAEQQHFFRANLTPNIIIPNLRPGLDITPTKRKNLETNPGMDQARQRGRARDAPATVIVPLDNHRRKSERGYSPPGGSGYPPQSSNSSRSPTRVTTRSQRSSSSPPRSVQMGAAGRVSPPRAGDYNTPRQQPQKYTSTSSSSSGEFQVQSRKRTPLLRNHAAGLPSTARGEPQQEDSIAGRKRISRSNSLTEIDSQLTVENFGGGGQQPKSDYRRSSSREPPAPELYSSRPARDLFATRDLFSGEEPIDRLRSSREHSLQSQGSQEESRSMGEPKSIYATPPPNSSEQYPQQEKYPPQQPSPQQLQYSIAPQQYSTHHQPSPQQQYNQSYYTMSAPAPAPPQKYYSLPRERESTTPTSSIYITSSPQPQPPQHYLSQPGDPHPINIVYLGQPESTAARRQEPEQEELAELEQIEELRRKLEEKKLAIERLRLRRIVHGAGKVATAPSSNSFRLHGEEPQGEQRSFHLHNSQSEASGEAPKTSFYLSQQMSSSDPTAPPKPFYTKPEQEPPVPPPRSRRGQAAATAGGMEPQSISFVQEPAQPQQAKSITSGTKTYRISTPDTSLSSGSRPNASDLFPQLEELEAGQAGGGFFIGLDDKENVIVPSTSNEEDLLEKKRQRILLQSLRRQQEAEELKRKKEEELERRREAEFDKLEQARRKKEEERQRREKILEGYRLRKAMDGEEYPDAAAAPPAPSAAARMRPKSSPNTASQRPKSIHIPAAANEYGRLQKSDSQSSLGGGKYGVRGPSAPPARNVWGSTSSLNKYNRFGVVRSSRFGGSARSLIESGPSSLASTATTTKFQQKSNRLLLQNAFEYSIFPGHVNHEQKSRILEEINRSESKYFLVLFRDAGLQFRGLYCVLEDGEGEEIVRLYGTGPRVIRDEMFDLFYKYNSGSKCFTPVHTRHLTVTIDAFTIQNALWQRRQQGAGTGGGRGQPGRDY